MLATKDTFRNVGPAEYTYHDKVFDNEMNSLVRQTDEHYYNMLHREAMKTGFYDLQAARDRYRDMSAFEGGMNWQLIEKFIEASISLDGVNYKVPNYIWYRILPKVLYALWLIAEHLSERCLTALHSQVMFV